MCLCSTPVGRECNKCQTRQNAKAFCHPERSRKRSSDRADLGLAKTNLLARMRHGIKYAWIRARGTLAFDCVRLLMELSFQCNLTTLRMTKAFGFCLIIHQLNSELCTLNTEKNPAIAGFFLFLHNCDLSNFCQFFGQTRNFTRSTFFRHNFAGGLHYFAFGRAYRRCCRGLVPGCNCGQSLFRFGFYRTATCSVDCVFLDCDQDSFFR